MSGEKFEQWCLLEIMGHQRFAGLVSEQVIGGASFIRIDVPATGELPAFTKLFGAGSIYSITPCTEDIARELAKGLQQRALTVYGFTTQRQLSFDQRPEDEDPDPDFYDDE